MDNCPFRRKYELVKWHNSYFGNSKGNQFTKSQLLAIWYKVARKGERR